MNYPDLTSAVGSRDGKALSRLLGEMHPADIADLIETLPSGDETFVFSLLSDAVAAEVLDEVEPETTQILVDDCGSNRLARILGHLETDDAAEIVDELKGDESAQILVQVEDAAALIGAGVPLALRKLRIDPTAASGPLITTLSDALSLSIYLSLAGFLLASP